MARWWRAAPRPQGCFWVVGTPWGPQAPRVMALPCRRACSRPCYMNHQGFLRRFRQCDQARRTCRWDHQVGRRWTLSRWGSLVLARRLVPRNRSLMRNGSRQGLGCIFPLYSRARPLPHEGLVWLQVIPPGSPLFPWAREPRAELAPGDPPRHLDASVREVALPDPRRFHGKKSHDPRGRKGNPRLERYESTKIRRPVSSASELLRRRPKRRP